MNYCRHLEKRTDHVTRYELHRLDERIWRLEKYTLEELKLAGAQTNPSLWPSFTSNSPRTYWNAIRHAVTSHDPRMQVRLPGFPGTDIDPDLYKQMLIETDRHEHFAHGAWANIDEQRIMRGMRPFQDAMAVLLAIRGGAFFRPWYDDYYTRSPFRVDLWDPKTVAYERGAECLDYTCHHYRTPYYDVVDRYYDLFEKSGKEDIMSWAKDQLAVDHEGNAEIFDCWWVEYDGLGKAHVYSAVIAGSGFVLAEPTEHKDLDHNPVYLIRSFGADVESEADYREVDRNVRDTWETIYTANRDIYPWINRVLTLYGIYLRNNAIGPWHARGTNLNAEQLMNAIKPFNVIQSTRVEASIVPLTPAAMASEVKEFNALLQGIEQRGSVPYSVYGQLPFELSGFAINQLQGAVGITAVPLSRAMGWVYRLATDELIQQFRKRGKATTVYGKDNRRQQFMEEIKRADLRDKYYLEVEVTPELPSDKLQTAQVGQAWAQMGIDPLTILDEVLKVSSPREVMKRLVIWKDLVGALEQESAANKAAEQGPLAPQGPMNGMPPEILPPEMAGFPPQEFIPNPQNIPAELLAAGGFI